MESVVPNPGSDEAVKQRCVCPRRDNNYGKGISTGVDGEPWFFINFDCPLHGLDLVYDAG